MNITNLHVVRLAIDFSFVLLAGLVWLGVVVWLRVKRKKSLVFLLFVTIFSIYLYKVVDYTLFQFQSLILLKYFQPEIILNGFTAGEGVQLVPLITLTREDLKPSLLNILLFLPFGFGLPFITNLHMKGTVLAGALLSIAIELLQLVMGTMASTSFRIADVNDVLFNTLGVVFGYILFVSFLRVYRRMSRDWEISTHPILRYVAERPQ